MATTSIRPPAAVPAGPGQNIKWSDARLSAVVEAAYLLAAVRR
jgi:hypothetical protein